MGKSMGSVAPSAYPTILARGLQPSSAAASAVINTVAAAPSDRVLALPAVTVPPSFWNSVDSLANLSKFTFLNSSSSFTKVEGFLLEHSGQLGKLVEIYFPEFLILFHESGGLPSFPLYFYLHQFIFDASLLICSSRLLVAVHAVLILFLSADPQLLGGVLPTVAHVELVINICESVSYKAIFEGNSTVRSVTSGHVVGDVAHALHAP